MNLIFIAGDDRSGSTMLDMMLAGHSSIASVGEAHHLRAYANKDHQYYKSVHDLSCLCGQDIEDCEFWSKVEENLGRPLGSLNIKPFYLRSNFKGKFFQGALKKIIWHSLQLLPRLYNIQSVHKILNGDVLAQDSFDLYKAVQATTDSAYVLDSSKSPLRMRALAYHNPESMKVILLSRDYRGVVNSKHKRGIAKTKAAYHWKWCMRQMEVFSKALSDSQVCRVRYEDLCNNTAEEMHRICDFLDLPFEDTILTRNTQNVHHLGGSPSKYAGTESKIHIDESYKNKFTGAEISKLFKIVEKEAKVWGYDDK